MNFSTFLAQANTADFWTSHKNICFVGKTYPMSFFNALFDVLKKDKLSAPYQRLFVDKAEKKTLFASLNQSILGMFSFFWLGNLSEEKESKATQDIMQTLIAYQGPNHIAYFLENGSKILDGLKQTKTLQVSIDAEMSLAQFGHLMALFNVSFDAKKMTFLKNIFSHHETLELDLCCQLTDYIELISSKHLDAYAQHIAQIIGASPTLSSLSEHFFAKNTKSFFSVWSSICGEYPDIFWISFWAEQIWRAHQVVMHLKDKNFAQAKRAGFRLPYSFMNRDWQKASTRELTHAYTFLYHMDYAFKTGSTLCSLELFYINHFNGKFS